MPPDVPEGEPVVGQPVLFYLPDKDKKEEIDYSQYYKNPHNGRLPIGSARLERKERRKRTLQYVTKTLFLGGAIGLIVISALRFTTLGTKSVKDFILNVYYLFFGILAAITQFNALKKLQS